MIVVRMHYNVMENIFMYTTNMYKWSALKPNSIPKLSLMDTSRIKFHNLSTCLQWLKELIYNVACSHIASYTPLVLPNVNIPQYAPTILKFP